MHLKTHLFTKAKFVLKHAVCCLLSEVLAPLWRSGSPQRGLGGADSTRTETPAEASLPRGSAFGGSCVLPAGGGLPIFLVQGASLTHAPSCRPEAGWVCHGPKPVLQVTYK